MKIHERFHEKERYFLVTIVTKSLHNHKQCRLMKKFMQGKIIFLWQLYKNFPQSHLVKILETIHTKGKHILVAIVTKFLLRKVRYADEICFFSFDSQNKPKYCLSVSKIEATLRCA